MGLSCRKAGVEVLAWCLMPNHVHLVLRPKETQGLVRALASAHQHYSWTVNQRRGWRGYLWQGRFYSFPMDEAHCGAAVRYVELNPVRARLVETAETWPWSSAAAHIAGRSDALIASPPWPSPLDSVGDWSAYLAGGLIDDALDAQRRHDKTGMPLGTPDFVARVETFVGRSLTMRPRGRPPHAKRTVERAGDRIAQNACVPN